VSATRAGTTTEGGAARALRGRLRLLLAVLLTGLVVITGRLSYLQLLHGADYLALSQANAVQPERLTPLRGRILARDGTVLAGNRVAVDLLYRGGGVARWPRLRYLLGLAGQPSAPDLENPEEARDGAVLAWNLPDETVPAVAELIAGQPNLYLRERLERTYPMGLAAHAVGTTTEADPERFAGYALGDVVGRTGIERAFQEALFGVPGRALLRVDSHSSTLQKTTVRAARPGQDVVLTLDVAAQRDAERVLSGALKYVNAERQGSGLPPEKVVRGALIAMNPQTGEILALASAPAFDPNVFVRRPVAAAAVQALLHAPTAPLTNRAVSAYPPASTFKVISSLALLGGGTLTPETRFECSPSFAFQGTLMRNWSPEDRGRYTVAQALADSCNTFFWRAVATTPGVTEGWGDFAAQLAKTARALGYGAPVNVGLPEEQSGRVPNAAWAEDFYGHGWYPGYTMNMTIGQGDLLATPLQVLQLLGTVALGGEQVQPHLVQRVGDTPTEVSVRTVLGPWDVVQAGMRRMITEYGGRWVLGPEVFGVAVAGKTGTAQNAGSDHAWFMGYGPLADPELAVVVFIENGGSSSTVAQPVARDFMQAYWSRTGRLAQIDP
jgi:penicillin-binding protein 2